MQRDNQGLEAPLPLTPAVFHVMLALADGEKHGYAILKDVEESTNGEVRLSTGTLYGIMKRLLSDFASSPKTAFAVSSAHPRMVDGSPSKNPRYLQKRPDLVDPRGTYLAEIGTRLAREIPSENRV